MSLGRLSRSKCQGEQIRRMLSIYFLKEKAITHRPPVSIRASAMWRKLNDGELRAEALTDAIP